MNFLAAILYAVSSSALAAIVLGFARGGLRESSAFLALGLGALVAANALWQTRREPLRWKNPGPWGWAAIVLFALFSLRAFLWLIFRDQNSIKVLSPNNLGDMSLHITYIRELASGVPFWPENPIYAGAKLTYPLGIDLFNTLLLLAGVDLIRGLIWVGLAGCVLTGVALWHWGRGFVLAGFLCNGGLLGFACFWKLELVDFQSDAAWKSIPLALFVTQRGLLFALPAGLALLCSWRARFFSENESEWRLPAWGEVLLYASMPLFHLHTFLFLSFVLGVWLAIQAPARKPLAALIGAAFVPATALVLLVTGMLKGTSALGWKAGWMWDDEPFVAWCLAHFGEPARLWAALLFWPLNFGILPLLVGLLGVRLFKNKNARWPTAIVAPSLFVFLLCCFVKFAPWEWDNTKLMLWSYLAILPALWSELIARWPAPARIAACVALFFSGFVSLLGGLGPAHVGHEIALRSEIDGVARAVRTLPLDAVFVGSPTFDHPLLLAGRPMAMGYEGHVWSHGYVDWAERKKAVTALMNGASDWREIAARLGVRYVFWGVTERDEFADSTQPWRTTATRIAAGEWGEIFDLSAPPPG